MSFIQGDGGNQHGHAVHQADQSGHQNGQSGHHSNQSGHHSLNIGDLSNDNMLGTDYQYWNISHFVEGLRINTGMRFAVLFIAFAGWLYIIYWIRHHEPFANQAIGVQTSLAPTAAQDRHMVAAIRNAFPLRTSSDMGILYVPSPPNPQPFGEYNGKRADSINQKAQHSEANVIENKLSSGPGQAISAPIEYPKLNIDERFGLPANSQLPYMQPLLTNVLPTESNIPMPPHTDLLNINRTPSTYQIRVNNGKSNLLRTIVSR